MSTTNMSTSTNTSSTPEASNTSETTPNAIASSVTLSITNEAPSILRLPDIAEGGSTVIAVRAFHCQPWIKEVIIPEGYTEIMTGAFRQCVHLRKVTLPSTLTHIGNGSFQECTQLEDINLGHVKHIGKEAFAGKSTGVFSRPLKLRSIDLRNIEYIGERAFYDCYFRNYEGLDLPNIRRIGKEAFKGADVNLLTCGKHLKSIEGAAFKYSTIDGMDLALCKNLTSIGVETFDGCRYLEQIDFPRENKLKQLRNRVFWGCESLKEIDLPEGLSKIGNCCFIECSGLDRVAWPASLKRVGKYAFKHCGALEKPPDAVFSRWISIGTDAFLGCKEPTPTLFENTNVFVEISADKLNSDVCGICLDSFMTNSTCQLSCKHLFHQHCAHEWYKRNKTCSNCRQPVNSVAIVLPLDKKRKRTVEEPQQVKRQCVNNQQLSTVE